MCLQLSEVSSTNNACSEPTSTAYVCRVHLDVLHCSVHVEGCGFASLEYNSNGLWHMTLYIEHLLLLTTAVSKQSIFYCTGCQSLNLSNTSCACWFTSRFWDTRRNISQTFWHRLPIFQVNLHCALHHVATSSCRGHAHELTTEPFLLLHCEHGTGYWRSWNCLWAPGYELTLWCALGLLVGGTIQVPQLQLQSQLL